MYTLQITDTKVIAGGQCEQIEQSNEKIKVDIPECIDEGDAKRHKMLEKYHDTVEYHRCNWP